MSDYIDPSQFSQYLGVPNFAQIPKAVDSPQLPNYGFAGGDSTSIAGGAPSTYGGDDWAAQLQSIVSKEQLPASESEEPASPASGGTLHEGDINPITSFLGNYSNGGGFGEGTSFKL